VTKKIIVFTNAGLPVTIEGLHKFILIGKEKLNAHKAKLRAIDKIDEAHLAKTAALYDTQDLAEALIDAEAKLGEMLAGIPKPKFDTQISGSTRGTTGTLPPGITKKESHFAQEIARHPEIVEQTKFRARDEERIVTAREILRKIQKENQKQKENPELPKDKFKVIYADPPWKYNDELIEEYGAASHHYPHMTINELCDHKIKTIAMDNSVLFLWVTSPLLKEVWPVIDAWGFKYKASFVWDKVKHNYGHYNSVRHEFLLICTRGSCLPQNNKLEDSVKSIKRSETHSEKPAEFRELIDRMYPEGNRIELFARGKLPEGWRAWGDESNQIL